MLAPSYGPAYVEENLASRLQFSLFTTSSRIYNTNLSSKNAWLMIPYDEGRNQEILWEGQQIYYYYYFVFLKYIFVVFMN